MHDKRLRYLLIAVLLVLLALGLLNVIATAFSLLLPLALVAAGGFAFYKIALEGRDDAATAASDEDITEEEDPAARQSEAQTRLSAVERARRELLEKATPAEEILDHIQARRRRLADEDDK